MSDDHGKITWFEIPAGDGARARSFYSALFGWTFAPFDGSDEYQMTREGGGAVYDNPGGGGITVYFGTSDIVASVAKVRELGGESGEPVEMPGVGRYATCVDADGNSFGLFESS